MSTTANSTLAWIPCGVRRRALKPHSLRTPLFSWNKVLKIRQPRRKRPIEHQTSREESHVNRFDTRLLPIALLLVSFLASQPTLASEPGIDFDTEIIPVLTRFGCNAGACHGSARGRGGFGLSLFGSNPAMDHESIVRQLEGRRVNLADPESSLILLKATEAVEHGGGERFDDQSLAFNRLRRWIAAGTPRQKTRRLASLSIEPKQRLLSAPGDRVTVSCVATFTDGTTEDVTDMVVITSDDEESVAIDRQKNELIVRRRGEHFVIVRYLTEVQCIRVGIPIGDQPIVDQSISEKGPIDRWVDRKLTELQLPKSPQADDFEFARRIYLDLAGRLPSLSELEHFVGDPSKQKRERLIDHLLASESFASYWGLKWAGVLAVDSKRLQVQGANAYHTWIVDRFAHDARWDETAFELLTASGDSYEYGPANFFRSADGPDGLAEAATQVFMGVRLRCANCHDHPLDHWNQDDYHGLAAIFARLKRGRDVQPTSRGEVTHPVTGLAAVPKIPGQHFLDSDQSNREAFATWLTNPDNPYFAQAAVNRVWAQLMGRGLIDPVDDLRSTNPASHPELLAALAEKFAENGYRFRPLIRMICNSRAYGRTSTALSENRSDRTYHSHFLSRPLEAEVIANSIADVTGITIQYALNQESANEPMTNAIELTDNRLDSSVLDILGRCDRSSACESPKASAGSIATILHLLNGKLLNSRLEADRGSVALWIENVGDDQELINQMYLRTLSRPLRSEEKAFWRRNLELEYGNLGSWKDEQQRREFMEDVLWGLLSSQTYLTNH